MTTDVSFGEIYTKRLKFRQGLSAEQQMLCFDQAKTNLFWLIEPRMDTEGLDAAKDNPKARDIYEFMDATTRSHLHGLPLPFLTYWLRMDKYWDKRMAQHWGDYVPLMIDRANEAHKRLLGQEVEAEDQFKLGRQCHLGPGIVNYQKAAEYYLLAADKGHARAQNNLGLLYSQGLGLPRDPKVAATWFMNAAEEGLDIAQNNIAEYYLEEDGVLPYDAEKAAMWFLKSAEQGNSYAQCRLGTMFEDGVGVPKNERLAKSFYLKAALQDDEGAQSWLWRRDRLESEQASDSQIDLQITPGTTDKQHHLSTESAVAVVRVAVELIKQSPSFYALELEELRRLSLLNAPSLLTEEIDSERALVIPSPRQTFSQVLAWLASQDRVSVSILRNLLLPLDMLPGAVIDELNERALDLTGDVAFEDSGDEIVVVREILVAVIAAMD